MSKKIKPKTVQKAAQHADPVVEPEPIEPAVPPESAPEPTAPEAPYTSKGWED